MGQYKSSLRCIRDDAGGKPILLALDEVVSAFGKSKVNLGKIAQIISVVEKALNFFKWNEFNAVVTTLDTLPVNMERQSSRPIIWVMLPRLTLGMCL